MNVRAINVTVLEPEPAASDRTARQVGRYQMALVPRKGEVIAVQEAMGAPRVSFRVKEAIYSTPDVGTYVEYGRDTPVLDEATVIVSRIVTAEDLQAAARQAASGDRGRDQRSFFRP